MVTIALFVMSLYDVIFAWRTGGDPTEPVEISSAPATTYNNPGFRDGRRTNGNILIFTLFNILCAIYFVNLENYGQILIFQGINIFQKKFS